MPKEFNENTKISDRFSKIKAIYFGNNNRRFAEAIDINETTLSSICNGKTNAGSKIMEKVLAACPDVSRSWLYFGEGSMTTSPTPRETPPQQRSSERVYDGSSTGLQRDNSITNTGNNNYGYIGGMSNEQLATILQSKDDLIAELKARIEDQRAYINMLSSEHRGIIHQILQGVGEISETTKLMDENAKKFRDSIGFRIYPKDQE